jgi:hypothetical protein
MNQAGIAAACAFNPNRICIGDGSSDDRHGKLPHGHPVLTLHTRHQEDDELLLSTYVHEQVHWLIEGRKSEAEAAMQDLRQIYPRIPVGCPEGSTEGYYEHLLVVYLEFWVNQTLLGELAAH